MIPCLECRGDQLTKHLHYLKMDLADLVPHLGSQFGDSKWARSGGIDAILSWRQTIFALYGDRCEDDGSPTPVWRAWLNGEDEQAKLAADAFRRKGVGWRGDSLEFLENLRHVSEDERKQGFRYLAAKLTRKLQSQGKEA